MGNCSSSHQTIIIHSPIEIPQSSYSLPSNQEINHQKNENMNFSENNSFTSRNSRKSESKTSDKSYHSNLTENNHKNTLNLMTNLTITYEIQSEQDIHLVDQSLSNQLNSDYEIDIPSSIPDQINGCYSKNQDSDSISGVISTISSLTSHSGSTKRSIENIEQRSSPSFVKNVSPKTPENIRASRSLFTPYKSQFSSSTLAYNTIDEHSLHYS